MSSSSRGRAIAALAAAVAAVGATGVTPASASARRGSGLPPFVPIHYIRLPLPSSVQPYGPDWMPDGRRILFQNQVDGRTWMIDASGRNAHCVTCGFSDDPGPNMEGGLFFVYSFPDEKRLFLGSGVDVTYSSGGAASQYGLAYLGALAGVPLQDTPPPSTDVADVIECEPSISDCRSHKVLPVDFSADANPTEPVGQRRTWHLSPDGKHLLWMEVRPDGTVMVVAKLVRESDRYVAEDPRDINPPGPTSSSDSNPDHWAYVGQTFEGKSFADGGREVEYLGGPGMDNFDVETVNLATGARHRLTSGPDWDEDGAVSPDGRYLVTASWRTMHRFDVVAGMLPELHPYIDLPFMSALVANYVSSHAGFQCDLTPWLLDGSGDHNGSALGQPLAPYTRGDSYVANNLAGAPMWSPGGDEVLLQERIYGPPQGTGSLQPVLGSVPSRLLIAKLDVPPSKPLPVASSDVGSWAPSPATAGTGFDHPATVTVHGKKTGTARITYTGDILSSADSVTYSHFSDDGTSFADGTETVDNPQLLTTPVSVRASIAITGAHYGAFTANLSVGESQGQAPSGTIESTFDGMSRSGLPPVGACPKSLPHPVPVLARATVVRGARVATVLIRVSAGIRGAGMNELGTDSRPIGGAIALLAGRRLVSNPEGLARTTLPEARKLRRYTLRVTGGDTFVPAERTITIPRRRSATR
jgi:hypothetical protein